MSLEASSKNKIDIYIRAKFRLTRNQNKDNALFRERGGEIPVESYAAAANASLSRFKSAWVPLPSFQRQLCRLYI